MDFCQKEKKKTAEILIEIVLYLPRNFGSIAILTILNIPICKHGVSLHLFISFLISSNNVFFIFSFAFLLPSSFVNILFFEAIISGILSLTSFSNGPLLVCRNANDFLYISHVSCNLAGLDYQF